MTVSTSTLEGDEVALITELRERYNDLARFLEANVPAGRRCSIALTELETSSMYAIKAVSIKAPN